MLATDHQRPEPTVPGQTYGWISDSAAEPFEAERTVGGPSVAGSYEDNWWCFEVTRTEEGAVDTLCRSRGTVLVMVAVPGP